MRINRAKVVVQVRDPLMIVLINKIVDGNSIAHRQANNLELQPLRLNPDLDVAMVTEIEGRCIHTRRIEVFEEDALSLFETVRCQNLSAENAPNGYLCSYHQKFLDPKVWIGVRKTFPRNDVDAATMKGELNREVLSARQSLADNEIHDHLTFERLRDVQVEEDIQRKYLERE